MAPNSPGEIKNRKISFVFSDNEYNITCQIPNKIPQDGKIMSRKTPPSPKCQSTIEIPQIKVYGAINNKFIRKYKLLLVLSSMLS
jgi:hypothetical protein